MSSKKKNKKLSDEIEQVKLEDEVDEVDETIPEDEVGEPTDVVEETEVFEEPPKEEAIVEPVIDIPVEKSEEVVALESAMPLEAPAAFEPINGKFFIRVNDAALSDAKYEIVKSRLEKSGLEFAIDAEGKFMVGPFDSMKDAVEIKKEIIRRGLKGKIVEINE